MLNIENLKKYFSEQPNILGVWIIGSYGTEYQREDSDIDFAILYDKDINDLEEMKFACDITEILKIENIDTINLKKAPITLQFKTIKEGRNLYEADYIKICDYVEYIINNYEDKKYYLDQFDKDYFASF
ncbi:nucleotidyltransferase domain-containing protein [Clostridium fermenticellae]|uniref:Nucleotidyltransferase domain-containing protein n=1 Tax=Clostridium fermenticellae TaxID=2068654 RepID=A0A386H265_9CLOT|nr:nucleotidyltransferase domain-containing protein [Clostridium fermenticellae]AYD39643.1 nucleotidyltransferase domain-containing protein [Clostridium fermenticellae]